MKKNNPDKLQKQQLKKERQIIKNGVTDLKLTEHVLKRKEMFKGNPRLKRIGTQFNYTEDHIRELKKCHNDPIYFINNYCWIVNLDEGLMKFKTRPYQNKLIKLYQNNRRVITKWGRQSGKSITTSAYAVWEAIFRPYSQIAILANKDMSAKGILQKVRIIYESLPVWIQQGVITWAKSTIELENGSKIMAAATSSSAIRSMSISTLIIDETAFIPHGIWDEFFASVFPTVSSSKKSKIFLISTPFGMNHFYKFWRDAVNKKSKFIPFEIQWDDVPGRDDKFKQDIIDNFSLEYFSQEFACEFLGSAGTLIDGRKLKLLVEENPIEIRFDNNFKIYELPEKEQLYVCLIDTGEGTGNDYSVVQVFKKDGNIFKQVAVYASNRISLREFPQTVEIIGKFYNTALLIIESNTIGRSVIDDLVYDLEYDNVFYDDDYGIRMTKTSKSLGNSNLKTNIEGDYIQICDKTTIKELMSYIRQNQTYKAEQGKHDDHVMPLVIFSYFLRNKDLVENWFDESIDNTNKKFKKNMENDLLSFGFVVDGDKITEIGNNDPWYF